MDMPNIENEGDNLENDKNWDILYEEYSKLSNQKDEIYKKLDLKQARQNQLIDREDKCLKLMDTFYTNLDAISNKLKTNSGDLKKLNQQELTLKLSKLSNIFETILSESNLNNFEINKLMDTIEEINGLQTKLEIDLGFVQPKKE